LLNKLEWFGNNEYITHVNSFGNIKMLRNRVHGVTRV